MLNRGFSICNLGTVDSTKFQTNCALAVKKVLDTAEWMTVLKTNETSA